MMWNSVLLAADSTTAGRQRLCRDRDAAVPTLKKASANPQAGAPCREALTSGEKACVNEHGTFRRETEEKMRERSREARASTAGDLSGPVRAMRESFVQGRDETAKIAEKCNEVRTQALMACKGEVDRITKERDEKMKLEDQLRLQAETDRKSVIEARRANPDADVAAIQQRMQQTADQRAQLAGQIPELQQQLIATEGGLSAAHNILGQSVQCIATQAVVYDEAIADADRQLALIAGEAPPDAPVSTAPAQTLAERSAGLTDTAAATAPSLAVKTIGTVIGTATPVGGAMRALSGGPDAGSAAMNVITSTGDFALSRALPSAGSWALFPGMVICGLTCFSSSAGAGSTYHTDPVAQWGVQSVSTPQGSYANERAIQSLERK